jgi:hypothetical protein
MTTTATDDDATRKAEIARLERQIAAEKRRWREEGHWDRIVRLHAELERREGDR